MPDVEGNFMFEMQVDDTEVINFLLSTEIIPLCLRTMEMGSELSKTVATFIVQKILLDNVGLNYICATAERFFAVGAVLGNMVSCRPHFNRNGYYGKHSVPPPSRIFFRIASFDITNSAHLLMLPGSIP